MSLVRYVSGRKGERAVGCFVRAETDDDAAADRAAADFARRQGWAAPRVRRRSIPPPGRRLPVAQLREGDR